MLTIRNLFLTGYELIVKMQLLVSPFRYPCIRSFEVKVTKTGAKLSGNYNHAKFRKALGLLIQSLGNNPPLNQVLVTDSLVDTAQYLDPQYFCVCHCQSKKSETRMTASVLKQDLNT